MKKLNVKEYINQYKNKHIDTDVSFLKKFVDQDIFNASTLPGLFVYKSKIGSPAMNVVFSASVIAAMFEETDGMTDRMEKYKTEYTFLHEIREGAKIKEKVPVYTKYINFMINNFMGLDGTDPVHTRHLYMMDKSVLDGSYDYSWFKCNNCGLTEDEIVHLSRALAVVYVIMWYANEKHIRMSAQVPSNYRIFNFTNMMSVSFARAMLVNIGHSFDFGSKCASKAIYEIIKMEQIVEDFNWDKSLYYDAVASYMSYHAIIKNLKTNEGLEKLDEEGYIEGTNIFSGPVCGDYINKYIKQTDKNPPTSSPSS